MRDPRSDPKEGDVLRFTKRPQDAMIIDRVTDELVAYRVVDAYGGLYHACRMPVGDWTQAALMTCDEVEES